MDESKVGWVKVTLFFPLFDNDGKPFDRETWKWWGRELNKLAVDFSEMGRARGTWRSKNDTNKWIMTVTKEEKLDEIRSFLREARKKFGQATMYLDYHPVFFELIE